MEVQVYQQDWMPGFAAFIDDQAIDEGKAHVGLNIGALVAAVATDDMDKKDIPYIVAECLMHEVIHALEAWAKVEFNEDRVEALLFAYRKKYGDFEGELEECPRDDVLVVEHEFLSGWSPVVRKDGRPWTVASEEQGEKEIEAFLKEMGPGYKRDEYRVVPNDAG